ncbi:MAG: hypothetical protein ACE5HX_08470 [bacterium]
MVEKKKTEVKKDEQNYHTYEPNPVPWWIVLMWIGYFIFGIVYILKNLL